MRPRPRKAEGRLDSIDCDAQVCKPGGWGEAALLDVEGQAHSRRFVDELDGLEWGKMLGMDRGRWCVVVGVKGIEPLTSR